MMSRNIKLKYKFRSHECVSTRIFKLTHIFRFPSVTLILKDRLDDHYMLGTKGTEYTKYGMQYGIPYDKTHLQNKRHQRGKTEQLMKRTSRVRDMNRIFHIYAEVFENTMLGNLFF